MLRIIKINKLKIFFLLIVLFAISLLSYYFGAISYHYKVFPFNSKIKNVQEKKNYIETAKNNLVTKEYNLPVYLKYGAIEYFNENIIFIDANGKIYKFDLSKKNFKKINSPEINNNKNSFIKKYEDELGTVRLNNLFGVRDIYIGKFNNEKKILLSSLDYNKVDDCYSLSLFGLKISDDLDFSNQEWNKIFVSKPCIKVDITPNELFAASSSGGRIEKIDNENILLTIGDFYADGVNGPNLSQNLFNDYGKILKINIFSNEKKFYSIGHRNPQGLFVTKNKKVFSTEHGPEGGDELNYILEDKNYGWPLQTHGTDYNSKVWPLVDKSIDSKFIKPVFSWGPKLGISNLIVYDSDYFFEWQKNIIISSLLGKKLIRIKYDYQSNKVLYLENIYLGQRIRDIIEINDGRIALLSDVLDANSFESVPKLIIIEKN